MLSGHTTVWIGTVANHMSGEFATLGNLGRLARMIARDLDTIDPAKTKAVRLAYPCFGKGNSEWHNKFGIGQCLLDIAWYEPMLADAYLMHPDVGNMCRAYIQYAQIENTKAAAKAVAS